MGNLTRIRTCVRDRTSSADTVQEGTKQSMSESSSDGFLSLNTKTRILREGSTKTTANDI